MNHPPRVRSTFVVSHSSLRALGFLLRQQSWELEELLQDRLPEAQHDRKTARRSFFLALVFFLGQAIFLAIAFFTRGELPWGIWSTLFLLAVIVLVLARRFDETSRRWEVTFERAQHLGTIAKTLQTLFERDIADLTEEERQLRCDFFVDVIWSRVREIEARYGPLGEALPVEGAPLTPPTPPSSVVRRSTPPSATV